MFTKPLSQTEYSDVETFCKNFREGIRVEYKSEMIENIPKTISAFANTLGGIIVIGVETDRVQNKVTAINGIDTRAGIKESIISSSLNGIYPSVIPEIEIFEVPEKKDKILVVVKVHESIEAPHAIQNSTRVYIRTGSTSQPYEFAEVDRIKYMLKRREKPEKLKEELRERTYSRCKERLGTSKANEPYLYISISPVFPYQPLISLDELLVFCNDIPHYSPVGYFNEPRRITDGILEYYGGPDYFDYREINHYGLVFKGELLEKIESGWKRTGKEEEKKLYVRFTHIILTIGKTLKLAEMFYNRCGYLGNLEVRVNIENIADECLLYNDEGFPTLYDYKATDNSTFSSEIIVVEDIGSNLMDIVTSLTRNVVWVFNCSAPNPQQRVEKVLIANNLIKKSND